MKAFLFLCLVYFIACSTDVETTCQDKSLVPLTSEDCFARLTQVGYNCCYIQVLVNSAYGQETQAMCYDYDKVIRVEEIADALTKTYAPDGHTLEKVVCPYDQHAGYIKAGLLLLVALLL